MIEIAIIVGPGGVRKTQIAAPQGEHTEGFRLYERLLPYIRRINAELSDGKFQAPEDQDILQS